MQIEHNNINFQALHASKRTLKKLQVTKTQLLQNQSVKDCAERAEVFVKSKRRFNSKKFDMDNVQSTLEIGGFLGTGAGLAGLTISGILMALGVVESSGLAWGLPIAIGAGIPIAGVIKEVLSCFFPLEYTAQIQAGDKIKRGKPAGRITKVKETSRDYLHKYNGYSEHDFKLSETLMKNGSADFRKIMDKYKDRDLHDTKTFLDIMNEDIIKKNFTNGDFFNYKLSRDGDSLLTKFFDIVPDENNREQYNQILQSMKNMRGIIYNQEDSYGISVLEKILNSENSAGLELVKDYVFPYSEEIDWAYNNISNEDFKTRAKNLKIDFKPEAKRVLNWSATIPLAEKIITSPFFKKEDLDWMMRYVQKQMYYVKGGFYKLLMKHDMFPQEEIDRRIQELEGNLKPAQNQRQNDISRDYGFYSTNA